MFRRNGKLTKIFTFPALVLALSIYLVSCKDLESFTKGMNPVLSKTALVRALKDVYFKDYKSGIRVFETEKGLKIEIKDRLLFSDANATMLSSTGKSIIRKIVELYKEEVVRGYPDNTITIVGIHSGSSSEAKIKAERKAKVVMKEFIRKGIHEDVIRSYGKAGIDNEVVIYLDLWQ